MKDHYEAPFDPRDLTKRLNSIQKSHSAVEDGDDMSRLPRLSRTGTCSSTSTAQSSHPFTFRKSATTSTTGSNESERLEVMRSVPSVRTSDAQAEVSHGEFSKPRSRRRGERRISVGSARSTKSTKSTAEFQYYGRHANSWLFNDFSVTDSVKKGWGKVFPSKGDE